VAALLLDTHVFIWAVSEPAKLSGAVRLALSSRANAIFVSAVTPWEISIKQALGRLRFPLDLFDATIDRLGYRTLPVLPAHGIAAGALPRHHNDRFDRMLIAQAVREGLALVTADRVFARYGCAVLGA
jgi:hypothetical protein